MSPSRSHVSDDKITVDRATLATVTSAATAFATMLALAPRLGVNPNRLLGHAVLDDGQSQALEWTPETTAEVQRAVIAMRRALGWRQ